MSSNSSSNARRTGREARLAIDPIALTEQVIAPYASAARERGIALRVRPAESVPARLYLDGDRTRAIVVDLVEEALGRITHGEVRIDLLAVRYEHVSKAVRLHIAVFTECEREADGQRLITAKEHAEHIGGHLTSEGPAGSAVVAELPAEIAPHDAPLAPAPWNPLALRSRRILIADDGAAMACLLQQSLRSLGSEVCVLGQEDEVLPAIERAATHGVPFDAIVLDHRYAEGDAIHVAHAVRRAGFEGVIALFASHVPQATESETADSHGTLDLDIIRSRPSDFPQLISDLVLRLSEGGAESRPARIRGTDTSETRTMTAASARELATHHGRREDHP